MKKNIIIIFSWFLLLFTFSGCNDYDHTTISVKMMNNSRSYIYMWVENYEERDSTMILAPNQSRTFYQVFTFTEDNPRTYITVVGLNWWFTSKRFLVNADTTEICAVYHADVNEWISSLEPNKH